MSNLNWFYSRIWAQKKWEKLLESRTIEVVWKKNDEETKLPNKIKLPDDLNLTDEAIREYLFNNYDTSIKEWRVWSGYETRI